MTKQGHIKALDGLRFVAAASVMVAHGVWFLVLLQQQENLTPLYSLVLSMANVGMTLFFVLSGFVIHFNYNDVLQKPAGLKRFFMARWSRLYPLFFLVFAIQLISDFSKGAVTHNMLASVAFYLTFTHSWWFWVVRHSYVGANIAGATGVMWSLSTEAFFYCAYPFFVAPIVRRMNSRAAFATMWPIAAIGAALSSAAVAWRGDLDVWAAGFFGVPVGAQFSHWVVYNSPWIRIFEFLLGVLAAQIVMERGPLPSRRADALAIASLLVSAAVFVPVCYRELPYGANVTTCLAIFIAFLCVAGASSGSRFSQLFASRPMVWGGEASYSLYLLHYWVLHVVTLPYIAALGVVARGFWLIVSMAAAVLLSRVTFVFLERPAMRLVRNLSLPRRVAAMPDLA